jgi:hypothetical protein
MKISEKAFYSKWTLCLCALVIWQVVYYVQDIRPWLLSFTGGEPTGGPNFTAADTYAYWLAATSELPWYLIPVNLIGPTSLMRLLDANFDLVVLFYVILFGLALRGLKQFATISILPFSVFFLANLTVMDQFLVINKEITTMISLLFIVVFINSGKAKHLIFAITIALFSKIEFLLLIIIFLMLRRFDSKKRITILVAAIISISIFYSVLPNRESYSTILLLGQTNESLGFTVFLEDLASQYMLFSIVLVPRLLLVLYAGGILYASPYAIALLVAILKKKLMVENDLVFLLFLYLLMVLIIPFPHFRYLLPTYPLLLIIVLQPSRSSNNLIKQSTLN